MRWEYRVVDQSWKEPSSTMLNELGPEGWELVAVLALESRKVFYFKRMLDAPIRASR